MGTVAVLRVLSKMGYKEVVVRHHCAVWDERVSVLLYICLCRVEQCETEKCRHSQVCSLPAHVNPLTFPLGTPSKVNICCVGLLHFHKSVGPTPAPAFLFHTPRGSTLGIIWNMILDLLFPGTIEEEVQIHIPMTPCYVKEGTPPMCSCSLVNSFVAVVMQQKLGLWGGSCWKEN